MERTRPTASDGSFVPTRWTLVLRARGDSTESRTALGALCQTYWQPVFRFLLREGRDEDAARELTQEFFARLLAGGQLDGADPSRGRFRSFLLGAVKHFLADARDRQQAAKRGGGVVPEPLSLGPNSDTTPAFEVADPTAPVGDEAFDRQWALTVIDQALVTLEQEASGNGGRPQFERLKPWLVGDAAGVASGEVAKQLGLSEGAFKVAVHRLRKRFRDAVKREIAQTVEDPALVQEELRYLVAVLARG